MNLVVLSTSNAMYKLLLQKNSCISFMNIDCCRGIVHQLNNLSLLNLTRIYVYILATFVVNIFCFMETSEQTAKIQRLTVINQSIDHCNTLPGCVIVTDQVHTNMEM